MTPTRRFQHLGEHAGLAVYQPRDARDLKMQLLEAIGRTVDVYFAGVAAADERYAGQNMYQERSGGHILQSSWIPEEDLRFLEPSLSAKAGSE
jgi:hypothetical protein